MYFRWNTDYKFHHVRKNCTKVFHFHINQQFIFSPLTEVQLAIEQKNYRVLLLIVIINLWTRKKMYWKFCVCQDSSEQRKLILRLSGYRSCIIKWNSYETRNTWNNIIVKRCEHFENFYLPFDHFPVDFCVYRVQWLNYSEKDEKNHRQQPSKNPQALKWWQICFQEQSIIQEKLLQVSKGRGNIWSSW